MPVETWITVDDSFDEEDLITALIHEFGVALYSIDYEEVTLFGFLTESLRKPS